jgi:hypothetical protein
MRATRTLTTVAALGGILQLAFGLAGYQVDAATVLPNLDDPAAAQAAHLAAHAPGVLFWVMLVLEAIGLLCFLAFASYLAEQLATAGAPRWLAATARATATTAIAVKLAAFAPALVAVQHPHVYGNTTTAALLQINGYADQVTLAVQGAFALVVGAAGLTARTPRWLTALAFIGGIGAVAAGFGFDTGQLASIAFTLAAAAWLIRTRPVAAPAPALATA